MAISFVAGNASGIANGANLTLALSASLQQNDLVVVSYGIGDNDSVNQDMAMVTAGYTELSDLFADGGLRDVNFGLYYKFMGATPDTTAVVDGLGGVDAAVAAAYMAFRGVDLTTPFDVTRTEAAVADTRIANPPSIDWVTPGVWTVIAAACSANSGVANGATLPTGYTTNALDFDATDTTDVTIAMGYNSSPSDPEDPGTISVSPDSVDDAYCAVTMALRPAPEFTVLGIPTGGPPIPAFT